MEPLYLPPSNITPTASQELIQLKVVTKKQMLAVTNSFLSLIYLVLQGTTVLPVLYISTVIAIFHIGLIFPLVNLYWQAIILVTNWNQNKLELIPNTVFNILSLSLVIGIMFGVYAYAYFQVYYLF